MPFATIYPDLDMDTVISGGGSETFNSGTAVQLNVSSYTLKSSANTYRAYVHWDLSSISGSATVLSGTLKLHASTGESATHEAHYVTSTWNESGPVPSVGSSITTWTCPSTGTDITGIDLTSAIQAWISGSVTNYGIRIKRQTEANNGTFSVQYNARENGNSTAPTLSVYYYVGAAVVFRSKTTTQTSAATSLAATKPTGLAVGDVMLAFAANVQNTSLATPTAPAGWTRIGYLNIGTGGTSPTNRGCWLWYKVADSSDVAASTFTFSNFVSGLINIELLAYSGAHATDPIGFIAASHAFGATPKWDSAIDHWGNGTSLLFAFLDAAQSTSTTPPSGYFERAEYTYNPGFVAYVYVGESVDTSQGVITAPTSSGSGTNSMFSCFHVVLRPSGTSELTTPRLRGTFSRIDNVASGTKAIEQPFAIAGDIIVEILDVDYGPATQTTPTGYTNLSAMTTYGTSFRRKINYKTATASDSQADSITGHDGSSASYLYTRLAIANAKTTPVAGTQQGSSSSSPQALSANTPSNNALVIDAVSVSSSNSQTAVPSGFTELHDHLIDSQSQLGILNYQTKATAGAVGNATSTIAATSNWVAGLIILEVALTLISSSDTGSGTEGTPLQAEVLVPDSDSLTTGWTDQAGGTTNLWSTVDDLSPGDTDYITTTV